MEQTLTNKKAQYEALALQRSYEGTPAQVYRQEQIAARREQEYLIAQNKYHDLIFKAPRDGVITYRDAEVGGYAPAGSRLLTLLDDSGFTVDCDITETGDRWHRGRAETGGDWRNLPGYCGLREPCKKQGDE